MESGRGKKEYSRRCARVSDILKFYEEGEDTAKGKRKRQGDDDITEYDGRERERER